MSRNTSIEAKKKAALRQARYRLQKRERYFLFLRRVVAHWHYRVAIRETLAYLRENIEWLSQRSGVELMVIKSGRNDDYGIFRPEEIQALHRCLPQVPKPSI